MAEQSSSSAKGGVGFLGLLAIVFIALKLTGFIHWSWWWVLAPLWGGFLFGVAIILIAIVIAVIADR